MGQRAQRERKGGSGRGKWWVQDPAGVGLHDFLSSHSLPSLDLSFQIFPNRPLKMHFRNQSMTCSLSFIYSFLCNLLDLTAGASPVILFMDLYSFIFILHFSLFFPLQECLMQRHLMMLCIQPSSLFWKLISFVLIVTQTILYEFLVSSCWHIW